MDDLPEQSLAAEDPADRSLVDDVRQLAADARTAAKAELAYQQSRAKFVGSSFGAIALRGALAGALVFFALMAIVFAVVLGLSPVITPWGAGLAVAGVLLLIALLLVLWARSRWRQLIAAMLDEDLNQ